MAKFSIHIKPISVIEATKQVTALTAGILHQTALANMQEKALYYRKHQTKQVVF
jgi:hypothetical protein